VDDHENKIIIRKEKPLDIDKITYVTEEAFKDNAHSNNTDSFIIKGLRRSGALTISLVAEIGGEVVGHIAFSPVRITDGSSDWYGLGPISVLPEYQNLGIGKAMVKKGLSMLKELGGKGCILVGDPGYYKRFGFKAVAGLSHDGVPHRFVLALPLEENNLPRGKVEFHKSFQAKG
jgi:putative acetyltransferase